MHETALLDSIMTELDQKPTNRIKVAVSDIDGILRGKYIHKDKFVSAVNSGFGFCSVIFGWDCNDACYDKGTVSGWHNGYPDVNACLDLKTYRQIPWDDHTPFFLADFQDEKGNALLSCPRQLLKKIIRKCESMGFDPFFGLEFEWFNFSETSQSLHQKHFVNPTPITPGMFGYSVLRATTNQPFLSALSHELAQFKIPLEGLHTETGPGVLEAALLYSDALEAADRGILFKTAVKEIAGRFGIMPTFMARWSDKLPGCGGHLHQSLWGTESKKNGFYDENDPHGMSTMFKHYLAGQMALLPDILPFYAPNVNSYKRLVEGFWAPTKATWGVDNRTTAFRVIKGNSKSTRLETRAPGSDINPYLAVAAALASGLYGIEHKLSLDAAPVVGNAYTATDAKPLARNLAEATEKMAKSEAALECFGKEFIEHFANTRAWEWRQFQQSVTTYERERYFEII